MNQKNIILVLVSLLMVACSSQQVPDKPESDKAIESKVQNLYLMPVEFADPSNLDKVKNECSMLNMLKKSIINYSSDYHLHYGSLDDNALLNSDAVQVKVEFTKVVPHRWTFMAIRPSSTASFRVSIYKNGEILNSRSQSIGSGMALGACDRLEKIARATGRYVNKWVSTQI